MEPFEIEFMENKEKNVADKTEEVFDFTGLLLECLSYWKWFVASVFILVALVAFYCLKQAPVYEVTSAVYIKDSRSESGNILLESLGLSSYNKNVDNEI